METTKGKLAGGLMSYILQTLMQFSIEGVSAEQDTDFMETAISEHLIPIVHECGENGEHHSWMRFEFEGGQRFEAELILRFKEGEDTQP